MLRTYFLFGTSHRTFKAHVTAWVQDDESLDCPTVRRAFVHGLRAAVLSSSRPPYSSAFSVSSSEPGDVFESLGVPWAKRNALDDALIEHERRSAEPSEQEVADSVAAYFAAKAKRLAAAVDFDKARVLEHEAAVRSIELNGRATIYDEHGRPHDPTVGGYRLYYQERNDV